MSHKQSCAIHLFYKKRVSKHRHLTCSQVRVCANEIFDCRRRINNNTFNYTHKQSDRERLPLQYKVINEWSEKAGWLCLLCCFWWNELCCDIFQFSIMSSSVSYLKALINCCEPIYSLSHVYSKQHLFLFFSFILFLFE